MRAEETEEEEEEEEEENRYSKCKYDRVLKRNDRCTTVHGSARARLANNMREQEGRRFFIACSCGFVCLSVSMLHVVNNSQ